MLVDDIKFRLYAKFASTGTQSGVSSDFIDNVIAEIGPHNIQHPDLGDITQLMIAEMIADANSIPFDYTHAIKIEICRLVLNHWGMKAALF